MASFAGPEDRRSFGITAFGIDIGAGLNEKMAQRMVTVDSSPL